MSRYVDIEGDWVDDAIKAYSLGYYEDDEYAIPIERFDSAPSIDIVRCRECKYASDNKVYGCMLNHFNDNDYDYHRMYADDFCSRGERKESER